MLLLVSTIYYVYYNNPLLYIVKNLRFFETGISNDNSLSEHEISTDSLENKFGDFVVARSDIGTSYNLAVVIDDAAQKITHVTRGNDLFPITPIQVLLQLLLNLPTPVYHHHGLIFEQSGKKMSKRSRKGKNVEVVPFPGDPTDLTNLRLKRI